MNALRCIFAWKHMCSKTIYATISLFVVFGLFEWLLLPNFSLTISGLIRLLVGVTFLYYFSYWLRFYYNMYEVSVVSVKMKINDNDVLNEYRCRAVEIGHRDSFARRAKTVLGFECKEKYREYPSAILYPDDILIVGKYCETYKEMRTVLRMDMEKRGVRWNNNFSLYEGIPGFLNPHGHFCNIVNVRSFDKSPTMAMAKQ